MKSVAAIIAAMNALIQQLIRLVFPLLPSCGLRLERETRGSFLEYPLAASEASERAAKYCFQALFGFLCAVLVCFFRFAHPMDDKRKPIIRQKPPLTPLKPGQTMEPGISLIQEKLIGRVVFEWSKLDAGFNELIWRFVGLSMEDGRLFTGRMDAEPKITILRTLSPRYLKEPILTEILHSTRHGWIRR